MTSLRLAVLATVAATLFACEPFVGVVTTTPPTRVGELDAGDIRISEGVAMAFECHDGWDHAPCSEFTATSEEPAVASVHPAHLDARSWMNPGKTPTAFVLMGHRAGKTTVTVRSGIWTRTYDVVVEPAEPARSPTHELGSHEGAAG